MMEGTLTGLPGPSLGLPGPDCYQNKLPAQGGRPPGAGSNYGNRLV